MMLNIIKGGLYEKYSKRGQVFHFRFDGLYFWFRSCLFFIQQLFFFSFSIGRYEKRSFFYYFREIKGGLNVEKILERHYNVANICFAWIRSRSKGRYVLVFKGGSL